MNLDGTAGQLRSSLEQAREGLLDALPNLASAFIIAVLGWVVAWALRSLIRRLLRRLAAEGPPGEGAPWSSGDRGPRGAGEVAANTAYWVTLLTALTIAVDALGLPIVDKWLAAFASYLPRLVISMVLLLGGVIAGRIARNAVLKAAARMPPRQARSLAWLTQAAIVLATILVAADQLGLDVSSLTAVLLIVLASTLGGGALAFGLGAREVMSDILAMHYVNRYYRVGQLIRVGTDEGRIIRTTRTAVFLECADGELCIPGREVLDQRCMLLNREDGREP